MSRLRVLVADDSSEYEFIYRSAINKTGLAKLITFISSYDKALNEFSKNVYDVVIIDKNFSSKRGIELLKSIRMLNDDVNIVMVTYRGDYNFIFDALKYGFVDIVIKQNIEDKEKAMLILKLHLTFIFNQIYTNKFSGNKLADTVIDDDFKELIRKKTIEIDKIYFNKVKISDLKTIDFILVAASTGGPGALVRFIKDIDPDINVPIFIVQHMPKGFTNGLASGLNQKALVNVVEASDGVEAENGVVYIAKGGYHMAVKKNNQGKCEIKIFSDKPVNNVIPAADVLFKSVANEYKSASILSIVLTGMGADGKNGVYDLKKNCNCYCLTQNEKSCVVYGMPKVVYENGLSDEQLEIELMGKRINEIIKFRR